MNKKTLNKLEYNKIIEMLTDHASSFNGRELCRKLKPMVSLSDINAAQQQTAAAFTRIVKKGRISFSGCNPVNDSLRRLEVGAEAENCFGSASSLKLPDAPKHTADTTTTTIWKTVWILFSNS